MNAIQFFTEDISFELKQEDSVRNWILLLIQSYGREVQAVNFIFCSDAYLLRLNQQHLHHDYYTDILTFSYAPRDTDPLFSDIYISLDRVKDNAKTRSISHEDELHRVMVHGILHLLGYRDQEESEKKSMRILENKALDMRDFI